MEQIQIRFAIKADLEQIKQLWKIVFGDDDLYVDAFLGQYFQKDSAMVLLLQDKIIAMVHMVPLGQLVMPGGTGFPCDSIYSFGTLPEYRGLGYGTKLLQAAVSHLKERGFHYHVICPAEEPLFDYYQKSFGYQDFFYVRETVVANEIIEKTQAPCLERQNLGRGLVVKLAPARPEEYKKVRDAILTGIPHISFDVRSLSHQKFISQLYGGDIYILDYGGELGCCCVEYLRKDEVMVKELLAAPQWQPAAIATIQSSFPAKRYRLRMPAILEEGLQRGACLGEVRPFAMLYTEGVTTQTQKSGYFGFAFD